MKIWRARRTILPLEERISRGVLEGRGGQFPRGPLRGVPTVCPRRGQVHRGYLFSLCAFEAHSKAGGASVLVKSTGRIPYLRQEMILLLWRLAGWSSSPLCIFLEVSLLFCSFVQTVASINFSTCLYRKMNGSRKAIAQLSKFLSYAFTCVISRCVRTLSLICSKLAWIRSIILFFFINLLSYYCMYCIFNIGELYTCCLLYYVDRLFKITLILIKTKFLNLVKWVCKNYIYRCNM